MLSTATENAITQIWRQSSRLIGGLSLKLSTKAAVFKRVSLLIGGQACRLAPALLSRIYSIDKFCSQEDGDHFFIIIFIVETKNQW